VISATIDTMTVTQARAVLGNNASGLSSEQIDRAQQVIDRFHAARPRNQQCVACSCMRWEEHRTAAGDPVWCCASCHRSADLTAERWHAQQTAEREAAEAHLMAAAAAAPKPRDVLKQALARLADARAALFKVEAALPAARASLVDAQTRHDAATAAAEQAHATAAEGLATAFFEGKPSGALPSAATARTELAAAVDALVIAKNARAILDTKLGDARKAVGYAFDRARKAARGVIAAEMLEDLLGAAAEARANYLETVGQLGWLVQSHAIPNGDSRPHQLLGEANTPPSAWREAATAGTTHMEAAIAALLADAEAAIA
jgi:hypothetical protein